MICTLVMQEEKRGEPSRKPAPRLPIIAPKDDYSSSASSSRSGQPGAGPAIAPRARLPPRSRTGCWTCRTRKVKCDEGRPICGQCSRLGHLCDYSPRLSFRDDTPRVVERMQEVSIVGNSIWDSTSPAPTDASNGSVAVDDLPPFAHLSTDEEREKKAGRASPGTYHVVVNPDSFQHLPEYSDDEAVKRGLLSPLRRGSIAASLASSFGKESSGDISGDPNTVVLPRFEDVARRKDTKSPSSPVLRKIKVEDEEAVDDESEASDDKYIRQFRTTVWRQLVPVELDSVDGIERTSCSIVETEAQYFPPLYHAMMAVAALSMSSQDGKERLDALQYYQKSLPALQNALKSTDDLSSDGAFLTHFLLLIYEIAAAEGANMWSQHLSTLLRISLLRREVFGGERYPFVVWWICMIDLDALFTGAGAGEYVGTMLKSDLIPPPSFHLYPLGMDGSSVVYQSELETLPVILQLDYEVTVLGVRLALLSQEFRQDSMFGNGSAKQRDREVRLRQSRIFELQESLRQLWATPQVMMVGQVERLPFRSKRLFEHAATLYRACIIYSHTSMWSTQRVDTSPDYDTEIAVASNQILHMTQRVLAEGRVDSRFLVFPCFMAGYASAGGEMKMNALELINRMVRVSIGKNTAATREALAMVYEKQNERFMTTGQSLDVDWMDVIKQENMTVVNFGI